MLCLYISAHTNILNLAGTPANRTQLPVYGGDNGFEDREGHQPPNHSQNVMVVSKHGN